MPTDGQRISRARLSARIATLNAPTQGTQQGSMKSAWRRRHRSEWTIYHWVYETLGIHPTHLDEAIPVHQKADKVPHVPEWSSHLWILMHAFIPIVIQHLYIKWTGCNFTTLQAIFLYSVALKLICIRELHMLRRIGHRTGFLDGDAFKRDEVPDAGIKKALCYLFSTTTLRPTVMVFLSYRTSHVPAKMNWVWLPLESGLYGIVLDFWYYWYHRLMHEVTYLWKHHRVHHLSKHPNPLLTVYVDAEQGVFDILGIPLLTYFSLKVIGLPLGFYEWWICHQYVIFSELAGHSGLRCHSLPPSVFNPLLIWFNCELIIEDHDLHHREGWRSSGNYGKQTRLWDRVFGTCKDRIECQADNIDRVNTIIIPLL